MDGLREILDTRQIAGEPKRRWFTSAELDLIVWLDSGDSPVGFQLCYDKTHGEHALTWRVERGYEHAAIDDGERTPGQYKKTPILVSDGTFDRRRVQAVFLCSSAEVPGRIRSFVAERLDHYPDG